MTDRSTTSILDRLRCAGAALPTSPDIESIIARAAQRKRRRQIGVTAASVVVVGGLGLSSAHVLRGNGDTSISAAGIPSALPVTTSTSLADQPSGADTVATLTYRRPAAPSTSIVTTTAVAMATPTAEATRRGELSDGLGGAVFVDQGRLAHRTGSGALQPIELPDPLPSTERRVADVAPVGEATYLLVSDFTDRPDLAASSSSEDDANESGRMHQELAIYAVDLTTGEVHVVEERTITEKHSPAWVYNGRITARDGNIVVVRELWQSMCVYVETLALDGTKLPTPENPLPEPSLVGLDDDMIQDMQAGLVDPPRGCIAGTELPDGAMSVLASHAEAAALDAINAKLRSAAAVVADAIAD